MVMTEPKSRVQLADELRRGGVALIAEAVADMADAIPGWDERNHARWLLTLRERVAAIPPGNVERPKSALAELREAPGATGVNAIEPTPLAMMTLERDEARCDRDKWQASSARNHADCIKAEQAYAEKVAHFNDQFIQLSASRARVSELEGELAAMAEVFDDGFTDGSEPALVRARDAKRHALGLLELNACLNKALMSTLDERSILMRELSDTRTQLSASQARVSELESKLNSITIPIDPLRDAVVEAARVNLAKLENYFEEYGAEHLADCPEDDTCECPLVVELNASLRVLQETLSALDASPEPAEGEPTCKPDLQVVDADAQRGLYRKYRVERLNDPTGKHRDCTYFVIDEVHDPFANPALRAYADACEETYPQLATDLRARHPLRGEWLQGVAEGVAEELRRAPAPEPAHAETDAATTAWMLGQPDERVPCCWQCTPDYRGMLICPKCGNKRCPHASDHRLACTSSNEPGQVGSVYQADQGGAQLLDEPAPVGEAEPHAVCAYCFKPRAECPHMGEPYWVSDRTPPTAKESADSAVAESLQKPAINETTENE
jgi:hypothetical protein